MLSSATIQVNYNYIVYYYTGSTWALLPTVGFDIVRRDTSSIGLKKKNFKPCAAKSDGGRPV